MPLFAILLSGLHVTVAGEHVSVDGTVIEACPGHKGFESKDDKDGEGEGFLRHTRTTRMNARSIPTAASTVRARARGQTLLQGSRDTFSFFFVRPPKL